MSLDRIERPLENPTFLSKKYPWLYWKIYHFSWKTFFPIFENKIAQLSPMASAAGYLVYLNDMLTDRFGFEFITGGSSSILGLETRDKLIFVYFGLMAIALGRLIYLWRRPQCLKKGPSQENWVAYGLREFTYGDFKSLYDDIELNQHRTQYGRYYTDDWEAFSEDARWSESGKNMLHAARERFSESQNNKRDSRQHVHYDEAKKRHESLLRGILIDRYAEGAATRKITLLTALVVSLVGWFLFILPSADLFLTVFSSVFFSM